MKSDKVDARTLWSCSTPAFCPRSGAPTRQPGRLGVAFTPRRAGPPAHPGQERAPRGAGPQPEGQTADQRRVRGARPRLASGPGPPRRRARDPRRLPAPGRLPRSGGLGGRAGAGAIGARIGGDPAADQRPGRQPRLGGDLLGHGRRYAALCDAPQAGLLRRARPAGSPVRRGAGASRPDSKQGSPAARHMLCKAGLDRGSHPGPAAGLLRAAAGPARGPDRAGGHGAQLCVLSGTCSPTKRTTPSGARRFTAQAAPLELVAGFVPARTALGLWGAKRERAHERELSEQFEAAYRRLAPTGSGGETGRRRDTGARISGPSSGQAARQGSAPEPAL